MRIVMRTNRRVRLALAVIALCTVALLGGLGAPAQGATKSGHDFVYYNDAAHQTVVGYRYYCIGNSGGWGSITPYVVESPFDC
jgi:uncharacterized protein DUF6289